MPMRFDLPRCITSASTRIKRRRLLTPPSVSLRVARQCRLKFKHLRVARRQRQHLHPPQRQHRLRHRQPQRQLHPGPLLHHDRVRLQGLARLQRRASSAAAGRVAETVKSLLQIIFCLYRQQMRKSAFHLHCRPPNKTIHYYV
jgi:hypothetical protein